MTTEGCLRVGQEAPEFTATAVFDQEFKTVKLSDYRGQYLILFFYPLDFTFVCPTEIIAFSERHERRGNLGQGLQLVQHDHPRPVVPI